MAGPIASEEDLVARFLRPLTRRAPGALGLLDDAALLAPKPGTELVLTADMLVAGVHFLADAPAADIATKAVTANLSDLVAKGADPAGYLMTLALPGASDDSWLADFAAGLDGQMGGLLLGGDLTRTDGPLTVSITAIGEVPAGRMVRRSGAKPGDLLFVSGPVGSAALGLRLLRNEALARDLALSEGEARQLIAASRAPVIADPAGTAALLRDSASAAIDLSDGLLIDLGRLCEASGTGAELDAASIPLTPAAARLVEQGRVALLDLVTGGDDYVALFAAPPAAAEAIRSASQGRAFAIGRLTPPAAGIVMLDAQARPIPLPARRGYDHFRAPPDLEGKS